VIAFSGLDPSFHQSGQLEEISRILKRGNRRPRRVIFLMTTGVVRSNSIYRRLFIGEKQRAYQLRRRFLPLLINC
jgi:transposase